MAYTEEQLERMKRNLGITDEALIKKLPKENVYLYYSTREATDGYDALLDFKAEEGGEYNSDHISGPGAHYVNLPQEIERHHYLDEIEYLHPLPKNDYDRFTELMKGNKKYAYVYKELRRANDMYTLDDNDGIRISVQDMKTLIKNFHEINERANFENIVYCPPPGLPRYELTSSRSIRREPLNENEIIKFIDGCEY
jgi:hypothetical protein